MPFYEDSGNRLIVLIEQLKLSILSRSVEETIKYFASKSGFPFLNQLDYKITSQGKKLSDALQEQSGVESGRIKKVLEALGAGNFASQKLDELRDGILKEKKENFAWVSASIVTKIGWLAFFAIIPMAIYFLSTMAGIFQSIGMSELVVSESIKVIVILVCAILFIVLLFSKRLKNG